MGKPKAEAHITAEIGIPTDIHIPAPSALYRQTTTSGENTLVNAYLLLAAARIDLAAALQHGNGQESLETIRQNIADNSVRLALDLKKILKRKL